MVLYGNDKLHIKRAVYADLEMWRLECCEQYESVCCMKKKATYKRQALVEKYQRSENRNAIGVRSCFTVLKSDL